MDLREPRDFALFFAALDAGDLQGDVPCHDRNIVEDDIGVNCFIVCSDKSPQLFALSRLAKILGLVMLGLVGIGAAIKARRKPLMTQAAFAEKLGLSQASISQWERENNLPSADQLPAIARVLMCSVEDIVVGVDRDYDRWRRDLARHSGVKASPATDSQPQRKGTTNADLGTDQARLLAELSETYDAFHRAVADVARDLDRVVADAKVDRSARTDRARKTGGPSRPRKVG